MQMKEHEPTTAELLNEICLLRSELDRQKSASNETLHSEDQLSSANPVFTAYSLLPYLSLDENGLILDVNQSWLVIMGGYVLHEVKGRPLVEFMMPDSRKRIEASFAQYTKSGVISEEEYELVTKTGEVVVVLINGLIRRDEQGHFVAAHCIVHDITVLRNTTTALQTSELKFKSIVESLPMGMHMYELDKDDKLIFAGANPAADHILRTDHTQLLGKSIEEAFPGLLKTDVPYQYGQIARNGKTWKKEQIEYNEGGISGAFEIVAFQTGVGKMVTVFSDITRRKWAEEALRQSEERLNLALSATNDGFWDYWPSGGQLYWSQRYCTMLGYMPDEIEPTTQNWASLIHPSDLHLAEQALAECSENRADYYSIEVRFRHKDGRYLWIHVRGKVISRDSNGNIIRMTGTHTDITDQKEMQLELIKAKEKAEESDRLKSSFLANLSHEIRTPMNAILGFSELMGQFFLTDEQKQHYIEIIKSSGHHLLSIINDIIEISKIETGQTVIRYVHVNPCTLMEELFHQMKLTMNRDRPVDLRMKKCSHAGRLILTDEVKLKQILTNLLTNAIKFTYEGFIELRCNWLSDNEIQFQVEDTGIGIDGKYHQLIFERFSQIDNDLAYKQGGSGLGLAISKAYVTMLGGTIDLISEPGKGSCFTFALPAPVSQSASVQKPREHMQNYLATFPSAHILIAEDDLASHTLLSDILRKRNCNLLFAANGKEATEICLTNDSINLVLMDIKMPEMNGYEAIREIRKIKPGLPVLAQTAYAMPGDEERILSAGFSGYITKPIDTGKLLAMIDSLLEKKR